MKATVQLLKNIKLRRRSPTRLLPCVNYHTKTKTPSLASSPISSTRLSNLSSRFNFSPFYPSLITFHDYSSNSIIANFINDITEGERKGNGITERKRNPIIQHEDDDPDDEVIEEEWEDDESNPKYGDGGAGGGIALRNVPWGNGITERKRNPIIQQEDDDPDDEVIEEEWEDDDESNPKYGDGGAGGGIALRNVPWGGRVLSIAQEVLLQFPDDLKLFAFKTTPSYYIYVRLVKLTHEYGCPDITEIERFNREFVKRLEEQGSKGKIPDSFGVEVSSPGANRLLKVPDDLPQFKDFPMQVWYLEEGKTRGKKGLFSLESIDTETEHCVWKLADVKDNRDPECEGKPLNRKQRDWRLKLPYTMVKKVALRCRDGT